MKASLEKKRRNIRKQISLSYQYVIKFVFAMIQLKNCSISVKQ